MPSISIQFLHEETDCYGTSTCRKPADAAVLFSTTIYGSYCESHLLTAIKELIKFLRTNDRLGKAKHTLALSY